MFDYPCDWKAGFSMDPTKKNRVGYLTAFSGLDLGDANLAQDISVFSAWNPAETGYADVTLEGEDKRVKCVGILDQFSFGGGVGDPICISAYISAENANLLSAKMKIALNTTKITKLGWWICNFDEENKKWYEESYPKDPTNVKGQLNAPGGRDVRLSIASQPTKVAPNIDVNVYQIYFEIIPAADATYSLHFATDASKQFVRNWGLVVGTQATAAMGT